MKKIYRRKLAVFLAGILSGSIAQAIELAHPHVDYFSTFARPSNSNLPQVTQPVFSPKPVGQLSSSTFASVLGWVPSGGNICGGYYQDQAIVVDYPTSLNPNVQTTIITAARPSLLSQSGTSVLEGNVTLTQPGRQIIADKAYLYRDPQTGKIAAVDMIGNVRMREAGRIVVSQKVHVDIKDNTANIQNAVYRFSSSDPQQMLNAWGTLAFGEREASGVLDLYDATYSTCPPTSNTWKVKAKRIVLNRTTGVGKSYNSTLSFFGFPLFYSPFFEFPIDDRRKSGFLFPTFGYTNDSGANFAIPYYLNLAPNYDATLTPAIFTKRGYQQKVNFRYLTHTSNGEFNFSILPYDRAFREFQEDTPLNPIYDTLPFKQRYFSRLEHASDTRYFISYLDNSIFNEHWSSLINVNYVSDDYYLQDFGATPGQIASDQLLNQIDLKYQGLNWTFLGRLQGYQTLHPITQAFVEDQYSRVPEFDLNADYPDQFYGLDFALDSQFVNFDHAADFFTRQPVVTGQRYRLVPKISLPLANMSGYFTPELQLDNTYYDLQNQNNLEPSITRIYPWNDGWPITDNPSSITRTLPIFDVDSGLFFDRSFNFFNTTYRQTLEPRLFYLYVPTTNQNDIPIFDTTLPPFSYEQMFQTNRFTGWDRIGDANQVTMALTTRFLDDYTGQEKLRASIGAMYLFAQHHVFCTGLSCMPDPTVNQDLSPVVGELSYNLNTNWNLTSDLAWDPNRLRTNDAIVNLSYTAGKEIFNFGYYFVKDADLNNQVVTPLTITPTYPPPTVTAINQADLNRIDFGVSWPVSDRWSLLANWNYNITERTPQVYFYGAQYDSCCWAARFIISRTLLGIDQFSNTHYDNQYYLQFQLKGLANFGYNDASSLLASALPGYVDQFQGFFKPFK